MALVRRIARPLLAAPFVLEGVRTVLHPERQIDVSPGTFEGIDAALASSPAPSLVDVRTLVRATGAVAAGAGLFYATGRHPRAAAVTLLVTTSVGWAGRKRVWELRGAERLEEVRSILVDAGLLGGVLLAVVDRDGSPSLGWRMSRFVERSQKAAERKQRELEKTAAKASDSLSSGAKDAAKAAKKTFAVQG